MENRLHLSNISSSKVLYFEQYLLGLKHLSCYAIQSVKWR